MAYVGFNPKFNTVRYVPQSADPTNPTEGQVFRSDGTTRAKGLWEYRDGSWKSVGTGTGSPDTICLIDADNYGSTSAFATGDGTITAGAELPGGTLQGTFSLQTGSVVEGTNSWRYVQAAGSLDSYIFSDVQTIDPAFRGKDVGVNIIAKYDGSDNDILFICWDETNNQILTPSDFYVKYSTTFKNYQTVFTIPSTCTQIRIGFQVKVLNSGKQLDWDMMSVFDRPFVMANVNDMQFTLLRQAQNAMTDITSYIRYNLSTASKPININADTLFVFEDNSTDAGTRCRILRDCYISIHFATEAQNSTGGRVACLHFNSSGVEKNRVYGNFSATLHGANWVGMTTYAVAGDFFYINADGQPLYSGGDNARWNVEAITQNQSVITPARTNVPFRAEVNGATSYSSGGANQKVTYLTPSSDPDSAWNSGSNRWVAPRDGYIDISANIRFNNTGLYNRQVYIYKNGSGIRQVEDGGISGSTSTNQVSALGIQVNKSDYIEIFIYQTSGSNSTLTGGSFGQFEIKYTDAAPLIATPVDRVAYLKEIQSSGTDGGAFTSGAWQTRTLNTVEGDSSFLTLSGNIFTLVPGTYDIEATAPAFFVNDHQARLYDVTAGAAVSYGGGMRALATTGSTNSSTLMCRVTITSSTQYRIEHRCETTRSPDGFGQSVGFGNSEVYTQVKIKKIR